MVGNPQTLSLSSDFDYIIKECQRNKTFVGSSGSTRGGNVKKQPNDNAAKSEDKFTLLQENMKALNIDNVEKNTEKSKTDNTQRGRGGARARGRGNSKNRNEKSNGFKKDNKDENDEDDDDDDDSVDNGTDKPSTSTSTKGNSQKGKSD